MKNKKSNRIFRIESDIKKIVTRLINEELRDPKIPDFVSVTDAKLTRDLSFVTIYVSTYGGENSIHKLLDGLERSKGYLRHMLAEELTTYKTPELIFKYDDSLEYGNKIDAILRDLNADATKNESKNKEPKSEENLPEQEEE